MVMNLILTPERLNLSGMFFIPNHDALIFALLDYDVAM